MPRVCTRCCKAIAFRTWSNDAITLLIAENLMSAGERHLRSLLQSTKERKASPLSKVTVPPRFGPRRVGNQPAIQDS